MRVVPYGISLDYQTIWFLFQVLFKRSLKQIIICKNSLVKLKIFQMQNRKPLDKLKVNKTVILLIVYLKINQSEKRVER